MSATIIATTTVSEMENLTLDHDVTEEILALPLERIQALRDTSTASDNLVPEHIGESLRELFMQERYPGTYTTVEDALCDFFDVESPEEITTEMVEQARAQRQIARKDKQD